MRGMGRGGGDFGQSQAGRGGGGRGRGLDLTMPAWKKQMPDNNAGPPAVSAPGAGPGPGGADGGRRPGFEVNDRERAFSPTNGPAPANGAGSFGGNGGEWGPARDLRDSLSFRGGQPQSMPARADPRGDGRAVDPRDGGYDRGVGHLNGGGGGHRGGREQAMPPRTDPRDDARAVDPRGGGYDRGSEHLNGGGGGPQGRDPGREPYGAPRGGGYGDPYGQRRGGSDADRWNGSGHRSPVRQNGTPSPNGAGPGPGPGPAIKDDPRYNYGTPSPGHENGARRDAGAVQTAPGDHRPIENGSNGPPSPDGDWIPTKDAESGDTYWYHSVSREVTWDDPGARPRPKEVMSPTGSRDGARDGKGSFDRYSPQAQYASKPALRGGITKSYHDRGPYGEMNGRGR